MNRLLNKLQNHVFIYSIWKKIEKKKRMLNFEFLK
jgi:hypothetical protein